MKRDRPIFQMGLLESSDDEDDEEEKLWPNKVILKEGKDEMDKENTNNERESVGFTLHSKKSKSSCRFGGNRLLSPCLPPKPPKASHSSSFVFHSRKVDAVTSKAIGKDDETGDMKHPIKIAETPFKRTTQNTGNMDSVWSTKTEGGEEKIDQEEIERYELQDTPPRSFSSSPLLSARRHLRGGSSVKKSLLSLPSFGKGQDAVEDENSNAKKSPSVIDQWRCKRCTFYNSSEMIRCSMCETDRKSPGTPSLCEFNPDHSPTNNNVHNDANSGVSDSNEVSCSMCTFLNQPLAACCEVCGEVLSRRPTTRSQKSLQNNVNSKLVEHISEKDTNIEKDNNAPVKSNSYVSTNRNVDVLASSLNDRPSYVNGLYEKEDATKEQVAERDRGAWSPPVSSSDEDSSSEKGAVVDLTLAGRHIGDENSDNKTHDTWVDNSEILWGDVESDGSTHEMQTVLSDDDIKDNHNWRYEGSSDFDDIEDFEDDNEGPINTHPLIDSHFVCVKDLERSGECAINFNLFVLKSKCSRACNSYENRQKGREKKKGTTKQKRQSSSWTRPRYTKKSRSKGARVKVKRQKK